MRRSTTKVHAQDADLVRAAGGTILPTHDCFTDALEYLEHRIRQDPSLARDLFRIHLVHGICLAPSGRNVDEPFAHAWVEEGRDCWQGGLAGGVRIFYAQAREAFFKELRVQAFTRYTPRQAWEENGRTEHYGPWLSQYQALCGSDRTLYGDPP